MALWFSFWAKDYLSDTDVALLTYEQQGMLTHLWAVCCQDGGIPKCEKKLGKILKISQKKLLREMSWIEKFFKKDPLNDEQLYSPRMRADVQKHIEIQEE